MTIKTGKIGVVLPEGFDLRAFANISEALAVANRCLEGERYLCVPIGFDWRRVRSRSHVELRVNAVVEESIGYDLILLLAEEELTESESSRLSGWLRRARRFGVTLGAVGPANWILASFGLRGESALALPFELQAAFKETFGEEALSRRSVAVDGETLSADGAPQAGAMILQWLRQRHGDRIAARVAGELRLDYGDLNAGERQSGMARRLQLNHPALEACVALMEENLEEPLSQSELARATGVSRRQIERLFLQNLGSSPQLFYRNLRLRQAHQLLLQTSLSVTEVGLAVGFVSVSHFSRVFRAEFGLSPVQVRKRSARERDFSVAVTLNQLARREDAGSKQRGMQEKAGSL